MNNATIPYVTRNLRHLLAAPNLTETQRTIITRTLATLSEMESESKRTRPAPILTTDDDLAELVDATFSDTTIGGLAEKKPAGHGILVAGSEGIMRLASERVAAKQNEGGR
jgi:hypothetical protein